MGRKIHERELEDWICEHWDDESSEYPSLHLGTLIGRQVQVKHGIMDLLSVDRGTTHVIELKTGALKEADIGQVLRYSWDVKWMLQCLARHHGPPESADIPEHLAELARQFFLYFHCEEEPWVITEPGICKHVGYRNIQPVLIGKSASLKVLSAAEAVRAEIYTWEYLESENAFSFEWQCGYGQYYEIGHFPDWAVSLTKHIWEDSQKEAEEVYPIWHRSTKTDT